VNWRAPLAATFLVVGLVCAAPQGATAAAIKTTTLVDEFGGPADTGCALREAIEAANTNTAFGGCQRHGGGADDVIKLRGSKMYALSLPGVENLNAGGDLDVIGTLAIEVRKTGRATIDGGDIDRVFDVRPGAELTGSRILVTGGEVATTADGGGIYNAGRLVLSRSAVTGNHIAGGTGSGGGGGVAGFGGKTILKRTVVGDNLVESLGTGGGVTQSGGALKLEEVTVDENTAYGGGGIAVLDAKVAVMASTISRNTATNEQFGGGGFYSYDGVQPLSPIRFTNVTISANKSAGTGGGVHIHTGAASLNAVTVTLNIADYDSDNPGTIAGSGGGISGSAAFKNSIVADNVATNAGSEDCYAASGGPHNVVGRATGCANPDVGTQNPRLGPLAHNGGPTKTHALNAGSPAIGKADRSAPGRDQRGRKRDSDPDAGAFERRA